MSHDVLHILSPCLGVDDVAALRRRAADPSRPPPRRVTRIRPARTDAVLNGGSIYWIFSGFIRARQRILRIEVQEQPNTDKTCALVLDRAVVPTIPKPQRIFRGWRYLTPDAAPADLDVVIDGNNMPEDLALAFRHFGLS